MRRRLTLAIVGLLTGALLLAGAGTLLVNRSAARHDTQRQLTAEATAFAQAAASMRSPRVLKVAARLLHLDNGKVVLISSAGTISSGLPGGLVPADLQVDRLDAGSPVVGWLGTLAYVAEPIALSPTIAALLPPGERAAIVVTRRVGLLGSGWLYFLLASGTALVVGAAVAAELSRRITRPVAEASTVARRIAGGELSARMRTEPSDGRELASLADSINAMAAGLEEARQRESRLLGSVSHDLRTPLTSIRGYAEAIHDGVVDDPAEAAGIIISASRRLERLVADLLELAKLDSDHLSLHLGPVDVGRVVGETVGGFGRGAEARGVELAIVTAPTQPIEATADPDRLAQVVANLIENSIDFARRSVRVGVAPGAPGFVDLVVEDDGDGIPAGDLTRVFDRFYQVDHGASARGGSGLGLSIVSELVRAMDGAVRAESPLGPEGGTRMVVTLRAWNGQR